MQMSSDKELRSLNAGFPLRKISIGWDRTGLFPSCIIRTARPKRLKILQLSTMRVADHRFKLEQKIGTEIGSILFRSGPIPYLFS